MLFENNVRENKNAFISEVRRIASLLRFNPDWLMAIMMHESGLNHRAMNSIGCIGLIQFCPGGGLTMFGLSAQAMANMTNVQQLQYVYNFFKPLTGQVDESWKAHLYAFAPSSFPYRNNLSHVIGSEVGQASSFAAQNAAFDINKNGSITVGEFKNYHNNWLKSRGVSVTSTGGWANLWKGLAIFGTVYYMLSD